VPIEHEAKILDVDSAEFATRILAAGGTAHGSAVTRRYTYDLSPGAGRRWMRLRDTAGRATLAIKEYVDDGISGTSELEVEVGDFATAAELLARLGFTAKTYQETRRTSYQLDGAHLEIDEWPLLPAYLEIEGRSPEHVLRVAATLGYAPEALTGANTTEIYARHGIDLESISELRFERRESEGRPLP
jgi:adenylate cyclase class 2